MYRYAIAAAIGVIAGLLGWDIDHAIGAVVCFVVGYRIE